MFPTNAPYPFHVLFIAKGRFEVASDDGRYSREFPTRKEAEIFCGALNFKGATEEKALELVKKYNDRKVKASEASRARSEAMKSLGMKRNTNGSWE